jgi:uncharacterized protein
MNKPIKILSLDGGGTRGLFPSTILECLQRETGKPPTAIFDVIVGAATGGIIAAALASNLHISEITDIYHKKAGYILPSSFLRKIRNPFNLFVSKYPNKNLKKLLIEKLGPARTFEDVYEKFGTSPVFLLAALDMAPDLQPGETPEFKVVIYNSAISACHSEKLVDMAMRNSAAVVNLPMYQHFTEGGNYANDPAMIGLAFALNNKDESFEGESKLGNGKLGLGAQIQDVRILSLGCGSTGNSYIPRDKIGNGDWGIFKWTNYLVNLVIDTNMVAVQYYLRQMLNEDQYLRINPYYHSSDAPDVLKKQKLKIDVTNPKQLDAIKGYAEKTFSDQKQQILDFLEIQSLKHKI